MRVQQVAEQGAQSRKLAGPGAAGVALTEEEGGKALDVSFGHTVGGGQTGSFASQIVFKIH